MEAVDRTDRGDKRGVVTKALFADSELALIDQVRGDQERADWVRSAVVRAAFTPNDVPPWPSDIEVANQHPIPVGFRLTEAENTLVAAACAGLKQGTWMRNVAVRIAAHDRATRDAYGQAVLKGDVHTGR